MLKSAITMMSFGILVVSGCATGDNQGVFPEDTGKTVPAEKRIELQVGGPHESQWATRDLGLTYTYTKDSGQLRISGRVTFKRAKRLDRFYVEANLIDVQGRILLQQRLASAGGRHLYEIVPFEAQINIPAETWGVAISYSGISRGIGEGAGSPNRFWRTPF